MNIVFIVQVFIGTLLPISLLVLAFIAGRVMERKHYESIHEREAALQRLKTSVTRSIEPGAAIRESRLVMGAVVVSIDHFKRLLGWFRGLVGGRVRSYESILDRGRREAVLRMKEQWPDADEILNLRLETSTISRVSNQGKRVVGCVEVIAYGTAVKYA